MNDKKITLLAGLGAGFEYYDFVIYGLLVTYLSHAFFPASDSVVGIIQIFAVFAIGYFARPLGGLIFGSIGDRFGRKKTFLISILLMAFATLAIGCLPTYHVWGIAATFLLIILRILQGCAYGADLAGATTFLVEHVNRSERGMYCAVALSSVGIGATFGSLLVFGLLKILTPQQMIEWGWRVPFLVGSALAVVGYFMRKKLQETPFFKQRKHLAQHNKPIMQLLRQYPKQVVLGIGISLFTACFIVFGVGLPAYLQQFYSYKTSDVYFYLTLGYIWSALLLPLFGRISDQIGRSRMLLWTGSLIIVSIYFLFNLLNFQTTAALAAFILIYETLVAALAGSYLALLSELFPTSVRFTGVAFCYNLVYCLAGFTPAIVTRLIVVEKFAVVLFFMLLAASTVLTTGLMQNQIQPELE